MTELNRVRNKIEHNLFEANIVRNNVVEFVRNMNFEREFLFLHLRLERLCQCVDKLPDRDAHVMELEFSRLKFREIKNIVDKLEEMLSALIDGRNVR